MTPRRPWKPNAIRDFLIGVEKPRRRRRKWTRQDWIVALGMINAAAILIGSEAPDVLGIPATVGKWIMLIGALAVIRKGMLEEQDRKAEQARHESALREARRLPPPKEEGENEARP